MSTRRTISPEFKARVGMEAISGRKTIQEIADDDSIQPILVSQWKRQLLHGGGELFSRANMNKDKDESQAKEAELVEQTGRLQRKLEWLKKISTALMPVTNTGWSITIIRSSLSAVNASCWGWQDPPSTTGSSPYVNRP